MTEPVPEPQIDQQAVSQRAAGLVSAVLLSVATISDQFATDLVAQQLLDAFTEGFYAGIDAAPLAGRPSAGNSDKA